MHLSVQRGKNIYIQRARELIYVSLEAADQAEVSRQALIKEGSALIPDLLILSKTFERLG